MGHMQMTMRNGVKPKLTLTLTLTDAGCPDPNANARIQKFTHYMATTPQLQNSMWIEFAHTHLHTTLRNYNLYNLIVASFCLSYWGYPLPYGWTTTAYQSKHPQARTCQIKTSPSQSASVKAITIEFYCKILLRSKLILKLLWKLSLYVW